MSVDKHISHLLFEHDCVIIPQFGGFVGNYKSAKIDRITHKFSPPSKEISFNKNLIHNDGLLANRISQEEKKSYPEANNFLKKYSEELKLSIKQGKKVEFSQIGVLYADEHQNIQFEPDYSANYLIDSFGLRTFHSPEVKKSEMKKEISLREKAAEITFTDRIPASAENKIFSGKRTRKYLMYSAAALPLLLLLFWIPFNFEKINRLGQKAKSMNYSNLIPFVEKPAPVYSERKEMEDGRRKIEEAKPLFALPDSVTITEISLFEKNDPEFTENKKIVVKMKEIPKILFGEKNKKFRFHIIAGCFEFSENAQKLVNALQKKGFDAHITDKHKGLFRVEFQNFRTRKQAMEALAKIKSKYDAAAWLLVK